MATPPPPLAAAIQQASNTYGVPVPVLNRVWSVESGNSYPNNFVNSSGYGGLFGTKLWNAPVQSQANYAASILAAGYSKYGNWEDALSYYRTGKPGQGYPQGSSGPVNNNAGASSSSPSSSSGSSSNPFDITGAINNFTNTVGNIPNTILQDFKPALINVGLGTLAIWLIVGGMLIIGFAALNKTTEQPAVQTALGRG